MPTARLPLNFDIKSRRADLSKDSRLVNAYVEDGDIVKRPGLLAKTLSGATAADLPTYTPGIGQGLAVWNDKLIAVQAGEIYSIQGTISTHLATPAGMSTLPVSFTQTTGDNYLAFHDGSNVYTLQKDIGEVISTLSGTAVESITVTNESTNAWYGDDVLCTIASGAGGTVTKTAHGLVAGQGVAFNTATGVLATGLTEYVTYRVAATGLTADAFTLETVANPPVQVTTTSVSTAPVYYRASPVVTITGAGTAAATARLDEHRVVSIGVTNAGSGASGDTTVTVAAHLVGTTATYTGLPYTGVTYTCTVTGTRYTSTPRVYITPTLSGIPIDIGYGIVGIDGTVAQWYCVYRPAFIGAWTLSIDPPTQVTATATVVTDNTITGTWCPGFPYLDGFCFLLDEDTGRIYNSTIYDPNLWDAANFILATSEADEPVALARHLNYIVAFSKKGTEFFYNAGNAAGSPLALNESAYLEIGCLNGYTIAHPEQSLIWLGEAVNFGRSVYMLNGLSPVKVSTPYIEKYLNILDNTDLAAGQVRAFCIKIAGHTMYVLNLLNRDWTFVYDLDEKKWYQWTSQDDDTTGYDGTEEYFLPVSMAANIEYASSDLAIYAQDNSTGKIYTINPDVPTDDGEHIYFRAVSSLEDSGTTKRKFYRRVEAVGDKIEGTLAIRHTDDDYATWSTRRTVTLSDTRPILYQNGTGRRRAWEIFSSSDVPIRLSSLEMDFDIGEMGLGQEG